MSFKNKVFVVTGGGNGIGREVVLQLLEQGASVAAVDINESSLNDTLELAKDNAKNLSLHTLNIVNKEQVEALPNTVIEKHGKVDGVLNIAGIIQPFIHVNNLDYSQIERVMNVNFYGTLYIIKAFLPHLLKNTTTSYISNVSSMGGFLPVPGQSVYGASKAAVKLLTEGLYAELKNTNVRVNIVFPGAIATNITKNSNVEIKVSENNAKQAKNFPTTSAKRAGEIILEGIAKEKFRIMVGKDAKIMDFLYRLNPKRAVNMITNKMKDLIK